MWTTLFELGPLSFQTYGLMVALGVMAAYWTICQSAKDTLSQRMVSDMILWTVLSGFLGGRLLYIFQNWDFYKESPLSMFAIWEGGLVFFGGLVTAFLGLFLFSKYHKLSFLTVTDLVCPSAALAHAFGRVGCFLNGCCYGKPYQGLFSVQYPFLAERVHVVQLYETAANLALFLALFLYARRKKFAGQITLMYFIGYGVVRFVTEFLRGDKQPSWGGLTNAQWIALAFFVSAAGVYALRIILSKVQKIKTHD